MSRALAPLGARSWQPKGKEGSELASESTTGPGMEMRSWEEDRGAHRDTQTGGTLGPGPQSVHAPLPSIPAWGKARPQAPGLLSLPGHVGRTQSHLDSWGNFFHSFPLSLVC